MSVRVSLLVWATVAALGCVSQAAQAERLDRIEPPPELETPERELPDALRYDDLMSLWSRIRLSGCRTRTCTIWLATVELYYASYIGRGPQGSDCLLGLRRCPDKYRLTSKRLDREIGAHPAWRPQLCDAIAVVAARDNGTAAQTHPDFGAYTLDLARRLTTPKLACLTKVWRAFRPGPVREEALETALAFCRAERAGARECAKLRDVKIVKRSRL